MNASRPLGILLLLTLLAGCSTESPAPIMDGAQAAKAESELDEYFTDLWDKQISGVVRSVHQDRQGYFWFAGEGGVARYDGDSLVYLEIHETQAVTVRAIHEDPDGTLWFAHDLGITRHVGETFRSYSRKDGLTGTDVWNLFRDSRGRLWAGTYDGAFRFDGNRFHAFALPPGKRDRGRGVSGPAMVNGILEDRQGRLWFIGEGVVTVVDGEERRPFRVLDRDTTMYVNGIHLGENDELWISTRYEGLYHFDGETYVNLSQRYDLEGSEIYGITADRDGALWFPVENAGVYRYDGNSFTLFGKEQGLRSSAVHGVFQDDRGRHWFHGWMGVYRYDGQDFVNVTREGPW